jgi:thiamine biosynthesis protein ThiI
METLFLIKYGEISLKGKNRPQFEARLVENIRKKFSHLPIRINYKIGRVYLFCEEEQAEAVEKGLAGIFGIISFAKSIKTEKDISAICRAALELAGTAQDKSEHLSFKIEARRTDKSFPLSSYRIACEVGDYLTQNQPGLVVDVRRPQLTLFIEIREKAYLYGAGTRGLRGLPVGCNGKGLLLLSGGIDSPVAGFLTAKRGLFIDAVYFHTHPFAPEGAREKVLALARVLNAFIPGFRLFVVNFTPLQVAIKEKAFYKAITLMSRASMMRIAELIALKEKTAVLITGECLGQVASQTPESLRFTESFTSLPVLRPLISMDKIEIIDLARAIGTFEISTRPFDDCCTIFAPQHPIIKPDALRLGEEYSLLELDRLIEEAADSVEKIDIG